MSSRKLLNFHVQQNSCFAGKIVNAYGIKDKVLISPLLILTSTKECINPKSNRGHTTEKYGREYII